MMDGLSRFISNLKSKWMKPRVYALIMKVGNQTVLMIEAAYSLEEAYGYAKRDFKKQNPGADISESHIFLFTYEEVGKLFERFMEKDLEPEPPIPPPEPEKKKPEPVKLEVLGEKSQMMKRIIEGKDRKLLEENRSSFSEAELRYLEDRIK